MKAFFLSAKNYGAFYAALSGLLFGLIGYFGISVVNANISVSTMLFWRFLVSSLFIFVLLIPQPNALKVPLYELIKVFFYGIAFYGGTSIFYFIAAKYIGSGLAMVLFFTYPAMVMFINFVLYRQKVSRIYYLALLIILIGMLCLMRGSQFNFNLIGLSMALLSALFYALYIIASKTSPVPPLVSTLWVSLGSAFTCLIAAILEKTFVVPFAVSVWINICGIGIICTALPIVLLLKGLKQISSLQASILSVLEPVFVVIFGILLLNEKVNFMQAIGVFVLLFGALLSLLNNRFEGKSKLKGTHEIPNKISPLAHD
ncbi:integral membrane protein [Legionella maceachernii]|uniref:Integral membrane protein n=1 Tax=Legionella maceachernii TaxID=466 RepID=A0A0W0VXR8_9GAMM|nr:DMT family transporter [Legionella maceachernii]KTD25092.1 integral membrane protein [Legionella maceachernii]SKA28608.1 Threonine/homoserine efflux transporter RhtA [Legionella maceachernii]SUP02465.1 Inner membrane transporter rhtA [Legionella maceachernii]